LSKIIKLTNIVGDHAGNPIYINSHWIVTIFEVPREPGGSLVTIIYGGPKGETWNVAESPREISKLIGEE
jgi:hypothetical protein